MKKLTMNLILALMVMTSAQVALAQCNIDGTITASANDDAMGPAWVYTLDLTWDTGTQYALSHMNLLMDVQGGSCSCDDFMAAISWDEIIGTSASDTCSIDYNGFLECSGDPSVPGVDGILLKFEPIEGLGCEPGTTGTATFTFYSNLSPAPIDADVLSLVDKFALNSCFGSLTGDFPAMTCDPVATETMDWGSAKSMFR